MERNDTIERSGNEVGIDGIDIYKMSKYYVDAIICTSRHIIYSSPYSTDVIVMNRKRKSKYKIPHNLRHHTILCATSDGKYLAIARGHKLSIYVLYPQILFVKSIDITNFVDKMYSSDNYIVVLPGYTNYVHYIYTWDGDYVQKSPEYLWVTQICGTSAMSTANNGLWHIYDLPTMTLMHVMEDKLLSWFCSYDNIVAFISRKYEFILEYNVLSRCVSRISIPQLPEFINEDYNLWTNDCNYFIHNQLYLMNYITMGLCFEYKMQRNISLISISNYERVNHNLQDYCIQVEPFPFACPAILLYFMNR